MMTRCENKMEENEAGLEASVADRAGLGRGKCGTQDTELKEAATRGVPHVRGWHLHGLGSLCFAPVGGLCASVSSCLVGREPWRVGDTATENRCFCSGPGGRVVSGA